MATESSRKMSKKTISFSGGSVQLYVIDEITFSDVPDRGQETTMTFYNDEDGGDREVHVVTVRATSGDQNATIDVERIDMFKTLDVPDRGQEEQFRPDNVTGEDTKPPRFVSHDKTHIFRAKNKDNADVWLDVERIDKITFYDVPARGQQTTYELDLDAWKEDE
jgi:hypothetical protein